MVRRRRRYQRMYLLAPDPTLGVEFIKLSFVGVFVLLASAPLVGVLTNFVASDAWLWSSLLSAAILIAVTYILVLRHLHARYPAPLREERTGIVGGIVVLVLFVLPIGWSLLQDVIGDPFTRMYGAAEKISVQATKWESDRRYGCDLHLRGAALGGQICLSQEEYDRLPRKVTVDLFIRRSALGYHIDDRAIAPTQVE